MKKFMRIYTLLCAGLVSVALIAYLWFAVATTTPANSYHSAQYRAALARFPAEPADDQLVYNFSQVYGDLSAPTLAQSVDDLYADPLYFNDTFNSFDDRTELRNYLLHTAENLVYSKVVIDDVARSNNDVYVRWTMRITAEVKGKTIDSESMGVSHLRFNSDGQVVVHQDYWDGVDGFYQHLPYVGLPLKLIREQL
ncbi:MAG: nuclear transport factor 2 family protein [Porticoccaceae bacterium]|nr:nuclear transport factor 2 family protein [Porticoccaceae bacterium]